MGPVRCGACVCPGITGSSRASRNIWRQWGDAVQVSKLRMALSDGGGALFTLLPWSGGVWCGVWCTALLQLETIHVCHPANVAVPTFPAQMAVGMSINRTVWQVFRGGTCDIPTTESMDCLAGSGADQEDHGWLGCVLGHLLGTVTTAVSRSVHHKKNRVCNARPEVLHCACTLAPLWTTYLHEHRTAVL